MRPFRLLWVGLFVGLVAVVACTPTTSPDEDCIVGGGVCFRSDDTLGCSAPLPLACQTGYSCCTAAYGANIVDGALIDAPTGAPSGIDAGSDAAAKDAANHEASTKDAEPKDGATEGGAAADATSHADTGAGKDSGATKKDAVAAAKDSGEDASSAPRDASTGSMKDASSE